MNGQRLSARVLIWPFLLLVATTGCEFAFGPKLRGSGVAKSESREVEQFSEIKARSEIQLEVSVGPAANVEVTADDNLLPHVKTILENDRLTVYVDESYTSDLGVKVRVAAPTLQALHGSGASKFVVSGVSGDRFELGLSGSSACRLESDAEQLNIALTGASRATLTGTAGQLRFECSGASRLDAQGLTAANAVAELTGASTAHVSVTDALNVSASGASTLRYAGQPAEIETNVTGASTVMRE